MHFLPPFRRLSVLLALLLGTGALAHAEPTEPTHPPIAVPFTLAEPGFVTLVIDDANGQRVRNLVSETEFPAGANVAWWDGLDDLGRDTDAAEHATYQVPGRLVAPGAYRVRGLVRPRLEVLYEMTPYTCGNPPWQTKNPASQWLANHTAPSAVLFVPAEMAPVRGDEPAPPDGQVLAGSFVSEGGSGLSWLNLDGRKLYGQLWLGGVWTGASHLARDTGEHPVPGVYAYAGSGWRGERKEGTPAELRLQELRSPSAATVAPHDKRMGGGDDTPLLKPTFKVPPGARPGQANPGDSSEDVNPLGGLAVRDGLLVAALPASDLLVFIDAAAHRTLGTAPLPEPHGLAFDQQGRLLVLSAGQLVRVEVESVRSAEGAGSTDPLPLPAPERLVASGLDEPQQLALDAAGNIYISEWGRSHDVKVFAANGQALRTIGRPGPPAVGPYDPRGMRHPHGLTLDGRGRLWVAETDKAPKRLSVWSLEGELLETFYGPAAYGGGGWLDPEDPTRFFYSDEGGGLELRLDWAHGRSQPVAVYERPELDPLGLRGVGVGHAPQTPLHRAGRTYLTNAFNCSPTDHAASAILWVLEDGVARGVAAMGNIRDAAGRLLPAFAGPEYTERLSHKALTDRDCPALFAWSDRNGDAHLQPEEVTFLEPGSGQVGGVSVLPDLSFALARVGNAALRFVPTGFTVAGAPLLEATRGEVIVEQTNHTASSGGGQVLGLPDGWNVLTTAPSPFSNHGLGGVRNGVPRWSYPSLWPGLHASHHAALPTFPGELIGTTRLLGEAVTPRGSDAGALWAINGNKGTVYFFTSDGLFVATVFRDSRSAAWDSPEARPGQSMAELSLGEESFWPTLSQTSDGAIHLVGNGSLLRVEGLERVRRLPDAGLAVDATQLRAAQAWFAQSEASRQQAEAPKELTVALRPEPLTVDGHLDDWAGAQWALIDQRKAQVGDWGQRTVRTEMALAIGGDRLFGALKTDDLQLLRNSGEALNNLFKTGGCLDVMIGTDPQAEPQRRQAVAGDVRLLISRVQDQAMAILYRPVAPGATGEPVQFASPLRTVRFGAVEDVSASLNLALATETDAKNKAITGIYEFSIPLATLGLSATPGTLRGDVGVLRGNGVQTLQRAYWSNQASGIVSDLPSEAELTPQLWGTFHLQGR